MYAVEGGLNFETFCISVSVLKGIQNSSEEELGKEVIFSNLQKKLVVTVSLDILSYQQEPSIIVRNSPEGN